ncbi:MAG: guanylate kinase [Saprospiraceae bacterium]|nr:guanylate kinase [Saprospiraceae bacterium]
MSVERFEGKMFIFTAPSGAGKTTIVRHLLEKYDFLGFSISATTRAIRDYETDGKDYYFMSVETFKERVANGDFVEWEEVYHGQFYGTLKSEVERIWAAGKHLVFDIDVRGAQNLKKIYTNKCMSVFVRPPSVQVLIQRLIQRNTETAESLEKRLNKVKREMVFENTFDIVLVNDLLEISLRKLSIL